MYKVVFKVFMSALRPYILIKKCIKNIFLADMSGKLFNPPPPPKKKKKNKEKK